jgi:hypothetical protein
MAQLERKRFNFRFEQIQIKRLKSAREKLQLLRDNRGLSRALPDKWSSRPDLTLSFN